MREEETSGYGRLTIVARRLLWAIAPLLLAPAALGAQPYPVREHSALTGGPGVASAAAAPRAAGHASGAGQAAPAAGLTPPALPARPEISQPRYEPVGDATRRLLSVQAGGVLAAPARPALGATAALTWQRYLDSFKHPQPLWFDRRVEPDE